MIGALTQPASLRRSYVAPFKTWAADNGCFTKGELFVLADYLAWLSGWTDMTGNCAFATAPDVVGDAAATWARSAPVLPVLRSMGFPAALVAQNGIEDMNIEWDAFDAIFLGGDTDWKLSDHARAVTAEAKRRGKWAHMGRVNSRRRLQIAYDFGCDSVDGNYLGYGPDKNIPTLLGWMNELHCEPRFNMWMAA